MGEWVPKGATYHPDMDGVGEGCLIILPVLLLPAVVVLCLFNIIGLDSVEGRIAAVAGAIVSFVISCCFYRFMQFVVASLFALAGLAIAGGILCAIVAGIYEWIVYG